MDHHVLPEYGSSRERLAAGRTRMRLLAGMGSGVDDELAVLVEDLAAVFAHELASVLVLLDYVLVQIGLTDHPPLAQVALILR